MLNKWLLTVGCVRLQIQILYWYVDVHQCQLLTLMFLKVIKTVKWLSVCRLGCELYEEIVEFLVEVDLSLLQSIQTTSLTFQSPLHWVSQFFSQHFKWSVSETDYWPATRIEVRNVWSFISTPPNTYVFVVWCLPTGTALPLWLSLHVTSQSMQQINFIPATKQQVQFQAITQDSFMVFYRVDVPQRITLHFGRGCFTRLKCTRKQNLQCLQVNMIASVSSGLNYQQTQH